MREKTSLALEKAIYSEARKYAIDADMRVNELVEIALIDYIKAHPIKKK